MNEVGANFHSKKGKDTAIQSLWQGKFVFKLFVQTYTSTLFSITVTRACF